MIKKIFFIVAITMISLICIQNILALKNEDINLKLDKTVYSSGENVNAYLDIKNSEKNNTDLKIKFKVFPENYGFEMIGDRVNFASGETKNLLYPIGEIMETTPSRNFVVQLIINENGFLIEKNVSFQVTGTKKTIDAIIRTCSDPECFREKSVFIKGETIYIKVLSSIENLIIGSSLTTPKKNQVKLNFIGYNSNYQTDENGNYVIKIVLNKNGYENFTKDIGIGVIEKNAEIKNVSLTPFKNDFKSTVNYNFILIIFGVIILFLIIGLIIIFIKRKK
jgi:hypothetical protein